MEARLGEALPLKDSWASSERSRKVMQGNRSRDTRPELAVRSAVHKLGLRYRVSARPLANLRRSADLVFRGPQIAVFVDGCYWHGCPEHYIPARSNANYWNEKIERNRARDADTDAQLLDAGWLPIRVWAHENPEKAAHDIAAAVAARTSTGQHGHGAHQ
jgi:DNA mismatch endonuclease (patch repair protein)